MRQQPLSILSLRFLLTEQEGSFTPVTDSISPQQLPAKATVSPVPHLSCFTLTLCPPLWAGYLRTPAGGQSCKPTTLFHLQIIQVSCAAEKEVKSTLWQSLGGRVRIWKDYRLGVSGDRQEETYGRKKTDTNKGQPMAKFNVREKLHRRVQRFFVAMSQTFERVTLISHSVPWKGLGNDSDKTQDESLSFDNIRIQWSFPTG